MTKLYLLTILTLLVVMGYEYRSFSQHYDGLVDQLNRIKKVCKVPLEAV